MGEVTRLRLADLDPILSLYLPILGVVTIVEITGALKIAAHHLLERHRRHAEVRSRDMALQNISSGQDLYRSRHQ